MIDQIIEEIKADIHNLNEAEELLDFEVEGTKGYISANRFVNKSKADIEKRVIYLGRKVRYFRLNKDAYAAGEELLNEQGVEL